MGEAQRRAKRLAETAKFSQLMKPARFDLFSIGARMAHVRLISEERSYSE